MTDMWECCVCKQSVPMEQMYSFNPVGSHVCKECAEVPAVRDAWLARAQPDSTAMVIRLGANVDALLVAARETITDTSIHTGVCGCSSDVRCPLCELEHAVKALSPDGLSWPCASARCVYHQCFGPSQLCRYCVRVSKSPKERADDPR